MSVISENLNPQEDSSNNCLVESECDNISESSETLQESTDTVEPCIDSEIPDEENDGSKKEENGISRKYQNDFLRSFQYGNTDPHKINQEPIRIPADILKRSHPNNNNNAAGKKISKGKSNNKNKQRKNNSGSNSAPSTPRRINTNNPNAWKIPERECDTEEGKRAEFNRKVNGMLNKLTLENFDSLSQKLLTLILDNLNFLVDAISAIFDKALGEPKFSVVYSKLCHSIHSGLNQQNPEINFRRLLVNKCEEQFKNNKLSECDANDEAYTRLRLRYFGNIKFIGELFIAKLIPHEVITISIKLLVSDDVDEEDLESLCKLLTTTGKLYEQIIPTPAFLDGVFRFLYDVRTNQEDISSRIKFMILDLEDLRKDNWVPRRKSEGPMKIADVQKEAKKKEEKNNRGLSKSSASNPNLMYSPKRDAKSPSNPHLDNNYNNNNNNNGKNWKVKSDQSHRIATSFEKDELKANTKQPSNVDDGNSEITEENLNNNNDDDNNNNHENNNDHDDDVCENVDQSPKSEPVIIKKSYASSFNTIIEEYLSCFDETETKESLNDLNVRNCHGEFIYCLFMKIEKKERIPHTVNLISYLLKENLIDSNDIDEGSKTFIENLEDILEDLPNAMLIFGEILAKLMFLELFDISAFVSLIDNYDIPDTEKSKFVSVFLKNIITQSDVSKLSEELKAKNFETLILNIKSNLAKEADLEVRSFFTQIVLWSKVE